MSKNSKKNNKRRLYALIGLVLVAAMLVTTLISAIAV